MSQGSPRVTVRLSERLLEEIHKELALLEDHSPRGPEDVSLFITRAIWERIKHRRRSRAKHRRPSRTQEEIWPDEIVSIVDP